MKTKFISAGAAFVLVLACGIRIGAQEAGLSLDQAVALALERHPDVLAARKAVDAARGRALQLGSRPVPLIALSVGGVPLPGLKNEGDETEIDLGFEQIFEYPGRRALRVEIGRREEALAEAELESVRLRLVAAAKKAYWRAAFARRTSAALERSEEIAEAILDNIQSKYEAGTAAYPDLLRARAEKARLRNQILEARKDRETARSALNFLLGRPADEPLALLTEMAYTPIPVKSLEALKREARTIRPAFKIAALRKERAAAAVELAGLGLRPDFVAGFSFPGKRFNAWGVSFGLTLPFLSPGRAEGERMEAAAEAELSRLAADALERRLDAALAGAYAEAKAAEEQILVFEESLLGDMEDEMKISLAYYALGKVEFTSLLDLFRSYVLTEVEHIRALSLYLTALADLDVAGEDLESWRTP